MITLRFDSEICKV